MKQLGCILTLAGLAFVFLETEWFQLIQGPHDLPISWPEAVCDSLAMIMVGFGSWWWGYGWRKRNLTKE